MAKKKKGILQIIVEKLFGVEEKKKSKRKQKKPSKKRKVPKRTKKTPDVRKIYTTTDGYFIQNPRNKKPRPVAVIDQRKSDGAVALLKIHSAEGKSGKRFLDDPILSEENHSALTQKSIIDNHVIVATKVQGQSNGEAKYNNIYPNELTPTKDELTKKEHKAIMTNLGNGNEKVQKSSENLLDRWHNDFKE